MSALFERTQADLVRHQTEASNVIPMFTREQACDVTNFAMRPLPLDQAPLIDWRAVARKVWAAIQEARRSKRTTRLEIMFWFLSLVCIGIFVSRLA